MNPVLRVRGLAKGYTVSRSEIVGAVRDIAFEVAPGEIFALLGPSGCGKTTSLRVIAGLDRLDGGVVEIDGQTVADAARGLHVSPSRRGLGMVFQSYAVWPHMTVYGNVAFPLQARRRELRLRRADIDARVGEALAVVSLDGMEHRGAATLSGGQQQRLAFARAIVTRPSVILLDEPLSNLDAKLRERMRAELRRLHDDLGVAMVFVTHDQAEALALSHRIAVMDHGRLAQVGTPQAVYQTPASAFVADFVGKTNFIDGAVAARTDDGAIVATAVGRWTIRSGPDGGVAGSRVQIALRPEDLRLAVPGPGGGGNGRIVDFAYFGSYSEATVAIDGADVTVVARVPPSTVHVTGDSVRIEVAGNAGVILK